MPRFIYRQGTEFDGTKMPAEVTLFGIEFLKNQATEVRQDMFREPGQYEHAVRKLRAHAHFEEDTIEDAVVVEVKPDRKRKAAAAPKPADPEPEASE